MLLGYIEGSLSMGSVKDMESFSGSMERAMLENGVAVLGKGKEYGRGDTVIAIMENG